jgi:protoporphyrinogen oxidase
MNSLGRKGTQVRSLVERFYYPRLGAGQLYERMADEVQDLGSTIELNSRVTRVHHDGRRIDSVSEASGETIEVHHLLSSAPVTDLVVSLDPSPPPEILSAAARLTYRAHITVNCFLEGTPPFPDNWIYVNSPEVRMARVANYRSFSVEMTPDPDRTAISVEYFCFKGDDLWDSSDDELGRLAQRELETTGLVRPGSITKTFVVREPDSYPTYYLGHQQHFDVLFEYLRGFENLTLMGRAGIYRYNNQDHSLLTGIYAARNYLGLTHVDLRSINADDEYLETMSGPHRVVALGTTEKVSS